MTEGNQSFARSRRTTFSFFASMCVTASVFPITALALQFTVSKMLSHWNEEAKRGHLTALIPLDSLKTDPDFSVQLALPQSPAQSSVVVPVSFNVTLIQEAAIQNIQGMITNTNNQLLQGSELGAYSDVYQGTSRFWASGPIENSIQNVYCAWARSACERLRACGIDPSTPVVLNFFWFTSGLAGGLVEWVDSRLEDLPNLISRENNSDPAIFNGNSTTDNYLKAH